MYKGDEMSFDRKNIDNAWCPGCGNFVILKLLKSVFEELGFENKEIVIVSGIGQAAKTPYYLDVNMFCGLHGRALPVATSIKATNPNLTVIAEGGDGDMYGEGGNHFINAARRDIDIVHIVHNNMVYGLTKGQASPTSQRGFKTGVQVDGVSNEPFNPLSSALSFDARFVSRCSVTDKDHAKDVLKQAFSHRGYALVDIFQPCVTFNKVNGYDFFKENSYKLEENYDKTDIKEAFAKSLQTDSFPLGVLYQKEGESFEEAHHIKSALFEQKRDSKKLAQLLQSIM